MAEINNGLEKIEKKYTKCINFFKMIKRVSLLQMKYFLKDTKNIDSISNNSVYQIAILTNVQEIERQALDDITVNGIVQLTARNVQ